MLRRKWGSYYYQLGVNLSMQHNMLKVKQYSIRFQWSKRLGDWLPRKYALVQKVFMRGRGQDVLTLVMMFLVAQTVKISVKQTERLPLPLTHLFIIDLLTLSAHSHLCVFAPLYTGYSWLWTCLRIISRGGSRDLRYTHFSALKKETVPFYGLRN